MDKIIVKAIYYISIINFVMTSIQISLTYEQQDLKFVVASVGGMIVFAILSCYTHYVITKEKELEKER